MSVHQTCFTGETLVAAENGQVRIDEIKVGDKVWAYDIYTGKTELKEVLTVYVHDQTEILHLHTTVGDIDTTTNHPFYVTGRGWVAAGDINEGDEVFLIDGSTAVVTGAELERLEKPIRVYNLEVEDYNTFFVGDEAVLVHNYTDNSDYSSGNRPQNYSPDGAGRRGAFREAKRQNGIPVSEQPINVGPNYDRRGKLQPGKIYEFFYNLKTIILRDDASGHIFPDDPTQNRGPHFNDPSGKHYDY